MKNVLKNFALAIIMTAFLAACAEEDVRPRNGSTNDKCQFTGKSCN